MRQTWIIIALAVLLTGAVILLWTRKDFVPPMPKDEVSAKAFIDSLQQARWKRTGDSLLVLSERVEAFRDSLKAARKPIRQRVNETTRTLDGASLGVLLDTLGNVPIQ